MIECYLLTGILCLIFSILGLLEKIPFVNKLLTKGVERLEIKNEEER